MLLRQLNATIVHGLEVQKLTQLAQPKPRLRTLQLRISVFVVNEADCLCHPVEKEDAREALVIAKRSVASARPEQHRVAVFA